VWAIGYTVLYPSWPGISGAWQGVLGWSSRGDLAADVERSREAQAVYLDRIANTEVAAILEDEELVQFAVAGGSSAYKVYCVQCHGSGASGGGGYPNLNDDDWIWGGSIEQLELTLMHGIRFEQDFDTLISDMPRYGADEILSREEISDVAWYVRSLSGLDHDAAAAANGAVTFEEQCSACHGDAGLGITDLGAPNLADAIWLYGGSHEELVAQISAPQQGVMPAWGERLGPTTVKQLAVYVHQLGGGE
ncbi:MAG: cytochrome-c oxidase, cbb3-type subunit III, partial [Pseudomonadota bacterium]